MENANVPGNAPGTATIPTHDKPTGDAKPARKGASFLDARHYILSEPERDTLVAEEPESEKCISPLMTSRTLLRGGKQYCLNLGNCTEEELENYPIQRNVWKLCGSSVRMTSFHQVIQVY